MNNNAIEVRSTVNVPAQAPVAEAIDINAIDVSFGQRVIYYIGITILLGVVGAAIGAGIGAAAGAIVKDTANCAIFFACGGGAVGVIVSPFLSVALVQKARQKMIQEAIARGAGNQPQPQGSKTITIIVAGENARAPDGNGKPESAEDKASRLRREISDIEYNTDMRALHEFELKNSNYIQGENFQKYNQKYIGLREAAKPHQERLKDLQKQLTDLTAQIAAAATAAAAKPATTAPAPAKALSSDHAVHVNRALHPSFVPDEG